MNYSFIVLLIITIIAFSTGTYLKFKANEGVEFDKVNYKPSPQGIPSTVYTTQMAIYEGKRSAAYNNDKRKIIFAVFCYVFAFVSMVITGLVYEPYKK
jgi:hypothetical protein